MLGPTEGAILSPPSLCHSEPAGEESRVLRRNAACGRDASFLSMTLVRGRGTEALHPLRFVGRCYLLHSGKDDAVRGALAADCMPGGEELTRDLRSHEPEPLTGVWDLSRL